MNNKKDTVHSNQKKAVTKKMRLGIIYGGKSGEHDVSRCSAASIAEVASKKYEVVCIGITRDGRWYVQNAIHIDNHPSFGKVLAIHEHGKWAIDTSSSDGSLHLLEKVTGEEVIVDVVFPIVHGTYGEDGTLQGLLEMVDVPYVGPGVLGSAVGMDKDIAKRVLMNANGFAIVPFKTIRINEMNPQNKQKILRMVERMLPVFIKPANAGSSVGISKVTNKGIIEESLSLAFKYDTKVIVEKAIDCREFEVSVMGNEEPVASVVGEIIPQHEYYSYKAKYLEKDGATLAIPATISKSFEHHLQKAACTIFSLLECEGLARVDFFVEKKTNMLYFNEINTLPGFTSISMYPKLWDCSGIPYTKLIDTLIHYALKRHRRRKKMVGAFLRLKK